MGDEDAAWDQTSLGRPDHAEIWQMPRTNASYGEVILFLKEARWICKMLPGSLLPLTFASFISGRVSRSTARGLGEEIE